MDPVSLLKKLTQNTCALTTVVERTKQGIEERQNTCDFISYIRLKELSMIWRKILSCIIKMRYEIEESPEEGCGLNGRCQFENAIHAAIDTELRTEVMLDSLEAKLLCLRELFTTKECAKENSNTVTADVLSSSSLAETEVDSTIEVLSNVDVEESSVQSDNERRQAQRKFELRRFNGSNVHEFALFWEEFQETVGKSSLSKEYKFAALRTLVRGEPYQLFLDLNSDAYDEAWIRLFNKYVYADGELIYRYMERDEVVRSLPAYVENESVTSTEEWSDAYFFDRYCKSVPNYKKPDRVLVVKAMKIFLKFYTEGPSSLVVEDLAYVWLILLHGTFKSSHYRCYFQSNIAFGSGKTTFLDLPHVHLNYSYNKFESECEEFTDFNFNASTQFAKVGPWMDFWIKSLFGTDYQKFSDSQFDRGTSYFALLSMVLFRVKFTSSESVEKFLNVSFDAISADLCGIRDLDLPKLIPPHPDVYHFIKTSLFKSSGSALQTYLTYIVGFYCKGYRRVQNFLAIGCCLPSVQRISASSIYWLEKAARSVQMKPRDFLEFLLVDPSIYASAIKIHKFLVKYRSQHTWRWARLFEKHRLTELTAAENLKLSYACFIFDLKRTEMEDRKEYPEEFFRFIEDADPPSLTGENLGMFLREMVHTYSNFQVE